MYKIIAMLAASLALSACMGGGGGVDTSENVTAGEAVAMPTDGFSNETGPEG